MSPAMMREKIEGMASSSPVITALDVGSSGIKALVYDASGAVLAEHRGATPIDRDGTADATAVADAVDVVVDGVRHRPLRPVRRRVGRRADRTPPHRSRRPRAAERRAAWSVA